MTNTVRIDIEVNDTGAAAAKTASRRIVDPMRQAADEIDRAFDKTSKQLATSLDRIEQEAWKSGKGMDDAFSTALTGLRKSLQLAREEASQTGATLHSSVGQSLNEIRKSAEKLGESLKPVAQATIPIDRNWEKTVRLFQTDLDRIERDAWDAGKGMDKAFQTAFASMKADFERVRDLGRRTGASLESELGGALRDVKKDMEKLGDEARQTGKKIDTALSEAGQEGAGSFTEAFTGQLGGGFDLGGMIEGLTGGGGGGIAAAGAAVGAAIAEAELKAFDAFFAQRQIGGLIAAQQGTSVAQAGRFGRIAGEAYYSGFADSVEEGGAALSGVLTQGLIDTDATSAELQKLTNMAATTAKIVGDDVNSVARAANQLIKTGLAENAAQAMDLITAASTHGANAAGDLMDTIEEYSIQFKRMGLSGQDSLGLINQALGAGARNADIAADAIKEFAIRSIDGTDKTARGFRTLGLDAGKMAADMAAGGSRARAALDTTLDALRNIHDPLMRNQAATDLFGTKAEDLGDALYAMDLDTVSSQLGDVAGATDKAGATAAAAMSPLDRTGRAFEDMGNKALAAAYQILGMNAATDGATGHYKKSRGAVDALKTEEEKLADARERTLAAIEAATGGNHRYVESLDEIIERESKLSGTTEDLGRAQIAYQEALAAANESLKENGKNVDQTTEAGRANLTNLYDLSDATWRQIEAMDASGATMDEVRGFMAAGRDQFVKMAISMGFSADQANTLADKLGLIPGNYQANVVADTSRARASVQDFLNTPRTLYIQAVVSGLHGQNLNYARKQAGMAHGGIVGAGGVWGAQSGGQRHSSTMIDEVGPEVVELPTGSRVMTAGATRAMAEAGAFAAGGGGGGPINITLMLDGATLARVLVDPLRDQVVRRGGLVQEVLGR